MSTNSTIFTGSSRFSSDLQQVLTRSVAIASLPLKQLNNQLSDLTNHASALGSLESKFSSLFSAIKNVSSAVTSATASSSNATVLTGNASSGASSGSYSINVISAGAQTTAVSLGALPSVSDPSTQSLTSSTSLTLTVGATTYNINPSANSLNSLADAINSSGAGVSATIINLGPPNAPNYKLSLQNEQLGNTSIQLNDGSQDLLSVLSLGSNASYQVNGQPSTPISSTSRTVTIAPGVTASLLQAGTSTLSVARNSNSVSDALSSFIAAYNSATDALAANRGQGNGALTADPIILTLQKTLRTLITGNATPSGSIGSLADLGINLDKTGKLSLDQTTLDNALAAHPHDVSTFLGSSTTSGFLKTAADTLDDIEDPITGTFQAETGQLQSQIDAKNKQIAREQSRIDLLQASLTAKIAASDALIASLEQQVSYFTSLFGSVNGTKSS